MLFQVPWLLLLSLLAVSHVSVTKALEASWIPADADGPLPQSTRYRDSLRQLCFQLKENGGKNLSPEIVAKKGVLKKVCQRLREDDISTGNGHLYAKHDKASYPYGTKEGMAARGNNIAMTLLVIAGVAYVMKYRPDLVDKVTAYFTGGTRGAAATAGGGGGGGSMGLGQVQAPRSVLDAARAKAREQARRAAWESSAANMHLTAGSGEKGTSESAGSSDKPAAAAATS